MAEPDPLVGRVVDGRYRIDEPLGEGAVAVVYGATHVGLNRKVALKLLRDTVDAGGRQRERFDREVKALASLSHPNIVTVTDHGLVDGQPYLVMERVDGQSLRFAIDAGAFSIDRAIDVTRQMLRGLAYAHGRGIVHRDLKPSNVGLVKLPEGGDHVKILDFGFAKFVGGAAPEGPALTAVGQAVGTPWYVAPEHVAGKPVDGRIDLYAVGTMLFEMIAGRRPFEGAAIEVVRAHLTQPAPSLRESRPDLGVPTGIDAIVLRAMEKDPDARYADAAAMLAALEEAAPSVAPADVIAVPLPTIDPAATSKSPPPLPETTEVTVQPTTEVDSAAMRVAPATQALATKKPWWPPGDLPIAVGLLVVFSLVVAILASGSEDEATVGHPPDELVMDFSVEETAVGHAGARAARDPWSDPVPEEIAPLARRIRGGETVAAGELLPLGRYARAHREDARPHLLLAYAYVELEWLHDAVSRFVSAFRVDPSCRGDERMQRDLVRLASGRAVDEEAGEAIWTIWHGENLGALERAVEAMEGRPEGEKLRRLVSEIRRRRQRASPGE